MDVKWRWSSGDVHLLIKNSFVSLLKMLFISAGDTPFEAIQVQTGELVEPEARFLYGHGCL